MKKILLIIPLFLLLIGCSNKHEEDKFAYLEYKNNLEKQEEFTPDTELDFNTYFDIVRDGDNVNYKLIINNPKKDMHNIKGMLMHDFVGAEEYPTIGIFNKPKSLYKEHNESITFEGTIISADDIGDVKFKLYLEYTDEDGKEEVYSEIRRG